MPKAHDDEDDEDNKMLDIFTAEDISFLMDEVPTLVPIQLMRDKLQEVIEAGAERIAKEPFDAENDISFPTSMYHTFMKGFLSGYAINGDVAEQVMGIPEIPILDRGMLGDGTFFSEANLHQVGHVFQMWVDSQILTEDEIHGADFYILCGPWQTPMTLEQRTVKRNMPVEEALELLSRMEEAGELDDDNQNILKLLRFLATNPHRQLLRGQESAVGVAQVHPAFMHGVDFLAFTTPTESDAHGALVHARLPFSIEDEMFTGFDYENIVVWEGSDSPYYGMVSYGIGNEIWDGMTCQSLSRIIDETNDENGDDKNDA